VTHKPVGERVIKPVGKARPQHKFRVLSSGVCQASFYGDSQATASGERFDPDALTAAHKTLPMGSTVRVINEATDRSVIVRINDRGPYAGGRCLDLSTAAMKAVGGIGSGVITAKYQVLARA
jgi:rare lipoprotein A